MKKSRILLTKDDSHENQGCNIVPPPLGASPAPGHEFWSSASSHYRLLDGSGGGEMRDISIWADQKLKGACKPHDWIAPSGTFLGGWLRYLGIFFRIAVVFFRWWWLLLPMTMAMACATHVLLFGGSVSTSLQVFRSRPPFLTVPSLAIPLPEVFDDSVCSFFILFYRYRTCVIMTLFFCCLSYSFELFTDGVDDDI
ncbi:hypothetical protein L484_002934 [Morus notabilis]|uniref:Uncharacterized protein n=1 Tax=Morus notabilis TaxID=981085 RepID=W9S9T2_9ROSA|nr:hypothetical protein L484_002934 [Morus notabilis]